MLVEHTKCSVGEACDFLGLPRSSYYYQAHKADVDDRAVRTAIEQVALEYPTYGSRRITHQLRRPPYQLIVNRKRVRALMRDMDLLCQARKNTVQTTNSQHGWARYRNLVQDLVISRPDQVWAADITYIRLQHGYIYLAIIEDVFTRTIRGWHLSRFLDQELTLSALGMALEHHRPEIHHSDQGVHYAARAYVDVLLGQGVQLSMSRAGKPEENGYVERVMRTIKEEEVNLSEYRDLEDAQRQIGHFVQDVYNLKRIHSALGYLTPCEFEAEWYAKHVQLVTADSPSP